MVREYELSTCISGSFKFKPEIDRLIENFEDLYVKVLAPEKGWLTLPSNTLSRVEFRPLPSERHMPYKAVEDDFLSKIRRATFLYVASYEGYTGISTGLEIGFAIALGKPIYSVERMDNLENDLGTEGIIDIIKVMTPEETVKDISAAIEKMLNEEN